ncbi:rhomboid family protein [Haloferax elongans ATCC BAA-1513]|uniref:Rhomboid family protein n=1 Tax=Haloferax elongans ATCC BAA-1513 TaxID=1230453 RepID=M0HMR7_HALEO|nr:rhomboid family intramembrane serine protease [Haloferax elongans]ELZ84394.1 rhomboid family protein [Haloferax elongans ATCC BAA-1513]
MSGEWSGFEESHPGADETLVGAVLRNPVVQTLAVMVVVSVATWASTPFGLRREFFVLSAPLADNPWTLVTSIYAHAGLGHLASNAVMVLIFGSIVALASTPLRFHLFFLVTGVVAGSVQIVSMSFRGYVIAGTLGSSGATFGLMGYVLASNLFSKYVLDRLGLPMWLGILALLGASALLTSSYSAPGSALYTHFTGALLGLIAGRLRLLHK